MQFQSLPIGTHDLHRKLISSGEPLLNILYSKPVLLRVRFWKVQSMWSIFWRRNLCHIERQHWKYIQNIFFQNWLFRNWIQLIRIVTSHAVEEIERCNCNGNRIVLILVMKWPLEELIWISLRWNPTSGNWETLISYRLTLIWHHPLQSSKTKFVIKNDNGLA